MINNNAQWTNVETFCGPQIYPIRLLLFGYNEVQGFLPKKKGLEFKATLQLVSQFSSGGLKLSASNSSTDIKVWSFCLNKHYQ